MFTLRWRDYPRERRIVRHRLRLGLLYPNATVEKGSRAKTSAHAKHDKPVAANPDANSQSLPKDWDEIEINHLVLAKDDSQWGRGGKPSRSRRPVTCSSSAGARNMPPTSADYAATVRLGADLPRRSVTVDHWIARAFCKIRASLRGPQTRGADSENPQHSAFKAMTASRAQRDAIRSTTAHYRWRLQ